MPSASSDSQSNDRVAETCRFLTKRFDKSPRAAIILGSGLGNLVDHIESAISIPYSNIPNWARTSASGHRGRLVAGQLSGQDVIAMAGRFHRYEGWNTDDVVFPVQVLSALGATTLIVSNAAGGVNPKYRVGEIVVIHDHIDLMHGHPSKRYGGQNVASTHGDLVNRKGETYDESYCERALVAARKANFTAHPGTYLATLGPNYETRAEYRMMRKIGADVVGMSTVPEVLEARRLAMKVLALSMVSNIAMPDVSASANHEEVLDAGRVAEPRLRSIVCDALKHLD